MRKKWYLKHVAGFSLIELMIAVAIVGILASIALPSYNSYMVSSRRANAQSALIALAQQLERAYTKNGSYLDGENCAVTPPTDVKLYGIQMTTCTASAFTITATGTGAQAGDGTLTLDQSGQRGGSVNSGNWKY